MIALNTYRHSDIKTLRHVDIKVSYQSRLLWSLAWLQQSAVLPWRTIRHVTAHHVGRRQSHVRTMRALLIGQDHPVDKPMKIMESITMQTVVKLSITL